MSKRIEIAGIGLDNCTVREALEQVNGYWDETGMNTIEAISMELLVLAGEDERLRQSLGALDLAIINDREILRAAGITSPQRIRETEEHQFLGEFMKYLVQGGKTVCLVGDTVEQTDALKEFLQEYYEKLKVVGSQALEACNWDVDSLVNEINTMSPDVVFSVLPTPRQEYFLMDNRSRMSAGIWYGLGQNYAAGSGRHSVKRLLLRLRHRGMLHRMLEKNNEMKKNE